jgi:hypothetical protein
MLNNREHRIMALTLGVLVGVLYIVVVNDFKLQHVDSVVNKAVASKGDSLPVVLPDTVVNDMGLQTMWYNKYVVCVKITNISKGPVTFHDSYKGIDHNMSSFLTLHPGLYEIVSIKPNETIAMYTQGKKPVFLGSVEGISAERQATSLVVDPRYKPNLKDLLLP